MDQEQRTVRGTPVPDAQITAWADEAEAGYDLPALRERAAQEGLATESEAIRAAVRACAYGA